MNFSNLEPGTLVFFNQGDWKRTYFVLGRPDDQLRLTRPGVANYMCLDENGNKRIAFFYKDEEEFMTFLPPSQEP